MRVSGGGCDVVEPPERTRGPELYKGGSRVVVRAPDSKRSPRGGEPGAASDEEEEQWREFRRPVVRRSAVGPSGGGVDHLLDSEEEDYGLGRHPPPRPERDYFRDDRDLCDDRDYDRDPRDDRDYDRDYRDERDHRHYRDDREYRDERDLRGDRDDRDYDLHHSRMYDRHYLRDDQVIRGQSSGQRDPPKQVSCLKLLLMNSHNSLTQY